MRVLPPSLVGATLLSLVSAGVHADVVRLSDQVTFGQGWMFLDQDGTCKVVTAAHVIRGQDGASRTLRVLTERGLDLTPTVPEFLSDDIAVMRVPAADDPGLCGAGRLSAIGAGRRLRQLADGFILTTNQREVVRIPVEPRASFIDKDDRRFAVRPALSSDRVVGGWSGSVVMDAEGPLGIVTDAGRDGNNEAIAVRVDEIRDLLARGDAGGSPDLREAAQPSITVIAGRTLDPRHGPDRIIDDVGSGWEVEPRHRTIVLTASFPRPVQVRSSMLEATRDSENAIEEVSISTAAELAGTLIDVNRCRAAQGARNVACSFAPRTVRVLRYVVTTRGDAPIRLRRMIIR